MPVVEKKLEELLRKLDDGLAEGMTIAQLTEVARAVLNDFSVEPLASDDRSGVSPLASK